MTELRTCFLLLQAAISVAVAQQTAETVNVAVARWAQDRRAAISLTFDDAMNSHLDVVEPILKKRGFTATFFVSKGRDVWRNRKNEWRPLGNEGKEFDN